MTRIVTDVCGPFQFSDIQRAIAPSTSRPGLLFGPDSKNQVMAITQGYPVLRYSRNTLTFVKNDGIAFTIGDTNMNLQALITMIFKDVHAVTIKVIGLSRRDIIRIIQDDKAIDIASLTTSTDRTEAATSTAVVQSSVSSLSSSSDTKSSKRSDSSVSRHKNTDTSETTNTTAMLQKIFEQVNGTRDDIVNIKEDVSELRGEINKIKSKMKKSERKPETATHKSDAR